MEYYLTSKQICTCINNILKYIFECNSSLKASVNNLKEFRKCQQIHSLIRPIASINNLIVAWSQYSERKMTKAVVQLNLSD